MVLQSKLFKSGNSKALRVSKQFGFDSDNVIVKKIDNGILVIEENKKNDFWDKWWNSFEKTDLERLQGKQEREDVF